ncbi:zinc finger and BTB domain-containing protein 41 [Pangasianodon hypophthalmus]|uniref:zinc finger and BTB domain-containing protein 41 n=1 Tax=Pangasianodon hypophthalmus TaxID=310915 RepID=UPI000F002C0D|nr:zinc finger and BTB domain-containing protein 41 [Pangasianodon hypophthalmus]XP_034159872.2 zinc finger and BTB domain-containing protein 41 [Pangasianodon hypophthalmus]XP_034159873.2 zinc finger and BTB domain-containing protein 41 [Pangasianodon hypophthalmus]
MKKKVKHNMAKKKVGIEGEASAPTVDKCEVSTGDESARENRRLRISQSDSCFLEFLNKDRSAVPSFCDIAITVCGEMYPAHKVVLAFGSSYFHAKLSENPQLDHMTFDNVDSSTFQHLLNFLYTSELEVQQSQIPSLSEAACFFDMMEAVNLLAGEATPTRVAEEGEKEEELPVEEPESSSSGELKKPQTPGETQCLLCSRTFCYKKSLENHMAKMHSQAEVVESTTPSSSKRMSTRQRRTPIKFESQESKYCLGLENRRQKDAHVDEGTTSVEEDDDDDDDEDDDDVNNEENQHEQSKEREQKETLEAETSVRTEEDTECRKEVESNSSHVTKDHDASVAQSSGGHVYPEGLAPVIIQSGNKKMLKCPKCDKTFDRIGKYESHTRVHTREKPFQCDVCLQRYSTKSNLTVHKKKHTADAPVQRKDHKCPFCNKLHASRKTLGKHVKRFHPDNMQEFLSMRKKKSEGWKCDICHKSFTRRPHLEEHMILHSQHRPFKCAYCDDYFKSRFARLKHQEKYHLGPFPCDICGRQFNDTGNRKRHIECTHGGKRKWTCFLCGKSVRERTTLREHLRIHSGEKPHLCSICGQSFRHGSSYRLHLRVHHDDKRYECEECGKAFIRHDHLKKHKKIHTGERAHQCEECGKCFRRADHLNVHYKSIHLGEKVWRKYKAVVHQCEVCKKEFRGKTNLMTHFRTHSGEKPHRCVICNQTFRIKKTLTKHMVIHSEVRPFSCPHCSAAFKRKDKLKYHVDHVHSARPPNPASSQTPETSKTSKSAEVCVPVALVPVQIPEEAGADLQQQPGGYQPSTDLVFLEKYTLTPQPANIVHPVRSDQILDPREPSYLSTLLGLDSASSEHAQ